jgi:carboxylesterase type B
VSLLLQVVEIITELPTDTLNPTKTIREVAHDWLDIDLGVEEDCLHLAVSTPHLPVDKKPLLPVMFYIHGGGFSSGFQFKMGPERLMAWGDVVLVAINYRLAALGFLCLDTDEAAGNMGMLDMVTALEWVHANIAQFGGDPNQITIFGESAGSATIGHLMLSPETKGLFARGIGSSGSPLAPWAFDHTPEHHARGIAYRAGCLDSNTATPDELVACLRQRTALEVSTAFVSYQTDARFNGSLGFGGSSPCAQSKGERKFYSTGQTPHSILFSGNYEPLPIFYGANKKEGSYVFAVIYNEFLVPNGLDQDAEYLHHEFISQLFETSEISNYYGLKELVTSSYFRNGQMGDLMAMMPGLVDFFSVFFIKAAAYEFVQANAKYAPSYWYAFDYDLSNKSLFHLQYMNPVSKANQSHPGTSHGDESIYLFDLEIPLVFCDLSAIAEDATACLSDPLNALVCLTSPVGHFRIKWQDCLTGKLNAEETEVSATINQLWTNFATKGEPGFGLSAWSQDGPTYIKIEADTSIQEDYTKEYHVALDESPGIFGLY